MIYQRYADHRRTTSTVATARHALKQLKMLLAVLPPKTTAELRAEGRIMAVQVSPPMRGPHMGG